MKRKEQKQFVKKFKSLGPDEKLELIQELFCSWAEDFHTSKKRSPSENFGFWQSKNVDWKVLCGALPAVDEDYFLTDYTFAEWFVAHADAVCAGSITEEEMDAVIRNFGLDPAECKRDLGTAHEMEVGEFEYEN